MNTRVHDNAGVMTSAQIAKIESARYAFDFRAFTGVFPSKAALHQSAADCVTAPNVVCAGVDPVHHSSWVQVGNIVGARPGDYDAIAAAGNGGFRAGDWAGGFLAIADRVTESTRAASAIPVVNVHVAQPPATSSSGWGLWILFAAVVALAALGWWLVRRVRRVDADMTDYRNEADEYRSRNIEQMTMPTPAAPIATPEVSIPLHPFVSSTEPSLVQRRAAAPAVVVAPVATQSTTVIHDHSGADMLLGYELGRASTPSVTSAPVRERAVERVVEEPRSSWSSSSSDSGGSSDWGSSSSSSSDWSSSSSDSGGGSDWGGGSSDSGGGGSDW